MPVSAVLPHRTTAELTARLDELRAAPPDEGAVHLVVRRPEGLVRELLDEGVLDTADGLVGDNWYSRATSHAVAAGRHLDAQVTVMSARMVGVLTEGREGQAAAGDQLYVDLDISVANLPAGSRLEFGEPGAGGPVVEVSAKPHNGCAKFTARFGEDAMLFVNSEVGKELRLRGFNGRVVSSGVVRPGDRVRVVRRGGLDDQTGTGARESLPV
jgi:MOSC domain-containing protein YiiM